MTHEASGIAKTHYSSSICFCRSSQGRTRVGLEGWRLRDQTEMDLMERTGLGFFHLLFKM